MLKFDPVSQLQRCVERRDELEKGVFMNAPKTWEEFQRRYGQWLEVAETIDEIEQSLKEGDEDESR